MQTEQLLGCVSEQTAFYVPKFPFNYGILCTARYWVETNRTYGQKLITQMSKDPQGSEWYSTKGSGYYDIVILTKHTDPDDAYCGYLKPILINFEELTIEQIIALSEYYIFTPFQRKQIVGEIYDRGLTDHLPRWKSNAMLDLRTINKSEEVDRKPGKTKGDSYLKRRADWINKGMIGPEPLKED